jgi:NifU-like protein involved in Fe-S cluster formation
MCDLLEGSTAEEVQRVDRTVVLDELGLPTITPARLKCALLPVEVLKRAVRHPVAEQE